MTVNKIKIPKTNAELPAYPGEVSNTDESGMKTTVNFYGLTKREYFAGQALSGILANREWTGEPVDKAAKYAKAYADALLRELGGSSK